MREVTKQKRGLQADMLHGPILRSMLLFAVPILISSLFQQLYNMMDTVIVGHTLGEKALAAMGACAPVFELLVGFALGVGNGLALVAARYFGSGDERRLKKTVAASAVIGIGISAALSVLAEFFLYPLLEVLHTPAEILPEAYRYISTVTRFVIVMFAYNLCAGLLRAIGDSFMPLVFLVFSSVLNILLDLLLVRGLSMGVQGAAAATVLAQGVSAVLCVGYIFLRRRQLLPGWSQFRPEGGLYRELLSQGLSVGFMSSIVSIGTVALQSGINSLGYLTMAAHESARKVMFFCLMPLGAIAHASSIFVSQNKGADQPVRIRRAMLDTYAAGLVLGGACWILMLAAGPRLVSLISGSEETELLQAASQYLRTSTFFFVMLEVVMSTQYALQGIGQKVLPLVSSAIELGGKLLFAAFFVPKFGYSAVIVCEPILWTLTAVWLAASFFWNPYIRNCGKK